VITDADFFPVARLKMSTVGAPGARLLAGGPVLCFEGARAQRPRSAPERGLSVSRSMRVTRETRARRPDRPR
jgi:hypothetical protein